MYLVDTPGFDDTYKTDVDVLAEVAKWLNKTYKDSILLTGIIYLHRIGDTRMGGSGARNLRMFRKLCGDGSLGSVVLATTMWSTVGSSPAELQKAANREKELMGRPEFWKTMIDRGSRVFRQDQGRESALEIIKYLLDRKKKVTLDIQRDMVEKGFSLSQTGAGREVEAEAARQRDMYEKRLKEMKEDMEQAIKDRDRESQKELAEYRREMEKKMKDQTSAIEKLRNEKFQEREEMKRELQQRARQQEEARREEERRERENEKREREKNAQMLIARLERESEANRIREAQEEENRRKRENEARIEKRAAEVEARLRSVLNNNNNMVPRPPMLPVVPVPMIPVVPIPRHIPYQYWRTM